MNPNLKPYKPGQSGNPAGKKPGTRNRATIARELLALEGAEIHPLTGEAVILCQEEYITLQALKAARGGDLKAYKALMDSAYGRTPSHEELIQDAIRYEPLPELRPVFVHPRPPLPKDPFVPGAGIDVYIDELDELKKDPAPDTAKVEATAPQPVVTRNRIRVRSSSR